MKSYYQKLIVLSLLLLLSNFVLMNIIDNYKSQFPLEYNTGEIKVIAETVRSSNDSLVNQMVLSGNEYVLLTRIYNYSGYTYYLEYYSIDNGLQWVEQMRYNRSRPTILAVSSSYIVIDILSNMIFVRDEYLDLSKSFLVFDLEKLQITTKVIPELRPFKEIIDKNNKTRYISEVGYTGKIIDNKLILLETTKNLSGFSSNNQHQIKVITYDLGQDELISGFILTENTDLFISAEIDSSSNSQMSIVVKNYLKDLPLEFGVTRYDIDFIKGIVVQEHKLNNVICITICSAIILPNDELVIYEKEKYGFPQIHTRLIIGDSNNQSSYIWDTLYQDIVISSLLISQNLVILFGRVDVKANYVSEAFVGLLSIENEKYNISIMNFHQSNWNSSWTLSIGLDALDNILITVGSVVANQTMLTYHNIIYQIPTRKNLMIDFFEDYQYLPYFVTSLSIIIGVVLVDWYITRKKKRIVSSDLYPGED